MMNQFGTGEHSIAKSSEPQDYARFFHVFSSVSKAIHSGDNTEEILEQIVKNISEIFKAKGCIFWIVNSSEEIIHKKISHGFSYRNLAEIDYPTLMRIFEPQDGNYVYIGNAHYDNRIPNLDKIGKRRVNSITGFLFDIVRNYKGILAVYFTDERALDEQERDVVVALGEQGAIALQKSLSYDAKMLETLRQMVEGFTLALEAKDEKTHGHSVKVASFAKTLAYKMGLSREQAETIYHGGLLHDIGKIGMNDDIIQRLGVLNKKEMNTIRQHPVIGERIIRPLVFLNDTVPIIRHHHERWDGSGYPDGLKGENIPLGARITTVCDAFETMISGRNHFEKMTMNDAIVNLQLGAGHHFDPDIVLKMFDLIEQNPEITGEKLSSTQTLEIHRRNLKNRTRMSRSSMFI